MNAKLKVTNKFNFLKIILIFNSSDNLNQNDFII